MSALIVIEDLQMVSQRCQSFLEVDVVRAGSAMDGYEGRAFDYRRSVLAGAVHAAARVTGLRLVRRHRSSCLTSAWVGDGPFIVGGGRLTDCGLLWVLTLLMRRS
jgi:hypothetical protein